MKRFVLTILFLLLLASGPIAAQGGGWSAYLYNVNSGELVRIASDGSQQTIDLGLGGDVYVDPQSIAFSADGTRAAYCAFVFQEDNVINMRLVVRDVLAGENLFARDLPNVVDCRVSPKGFSAAGNQIVVGVVNYLSPGSDATDRPIWELLIIDAATGNLEEALNANTPFLAELGRDQQAAYMPDVRLFDDQRVIFAQIPLTGSSGGVDAPAIEWGRATPSAIDVPQWGKFGLDVLEFTGEMVWIEHNADMAAGPQGNTVLPFNTLILAEPLQPARMIYHSPDRVILSAHFINGGSQIALQMADGVWLALDRAGNVSALPLGTGLYAEMVPTGTGYLHLNFDYESPEALRPITQVSFGSSLAWESNSEFWSIVWASPFPPGEGLQQSFPAYAN